MKAFRAINLKMLPLKNVIRVDLVEHRVKRSHLRSKCIDLLRMSLRQCVNNSNGLMSVINVFAADPGKDEREEAATVVDDCAKHRKNGGRLPPFLPCRTCIRHPAIFTYIHSQVRKCTLTNVYRHGVPWSSRLLILRSKCPV